MLFCCNALAQYRRVDLLISTDPFVGKVSPMRGQGISNVLERPLPHRSIFGSLKECDEFIKLVK